MALIYEMLTARQSLVVDYLLYPVETHAEIAGRLGIGRRAASRLIGRARKRLNAVALPDRVRRRPVRVIRLGNWSI